MMKQIAVIIFSSFISHSTPRVDELACAQTDRGASTTYHKLGFLLSLNKSDGDNLHELGIRDMPRGEQKHLIRVPTQNLTVAGAALLFTIVHPLETLIARSRMMQLAQHKFPRFL